MLFRKLQDFNHLNVSSVSPEPGIYIIYKRVRGIDRPFYIGRSRVDLRARLWCHLRGAGSRKVAAAILWGERLKFEYELMMSSEQAEANLIHKIGLVNLANLRAETDPADRW